MCRSTQALPDTRVGVAQAVAAHAYGIDMDTIRRPGPGTRETSKARQVAMYLAHVGLRIGTTTVARSFGRTHKSVAYACQQIEAAREDPSFNRTLDWMETLVRRATEAPV